MALWKTVLFAYLIVLLPGHRRFSFTLTGTKKYSLLQVTYPKNIKRKRNTEGQEHKSYESDHVILSSLYFCSRLRFGLSVPIVGSEFNVEILNGEKLVVMQDLNYFC